MPFSDHDALQSTLNLSFHFCSSFEFTIKVGFLFQCVLTMICFCNLTSNQIPLTSVLWLLIMFWDFLSVVITSQVYHRILWLEGTQEIFTPTPYLRQVSLYHPGQMDDFSPPPNFQSKRVLTQDASFNLHIFQYHLLLKSCSLSHKFRRVKQSEVKLKVPSNCFKVRPFSEALQQCLKQTGRAEPVFIF